MGFFGSLISGVVKTAISPVAVVKDTFDVLQGEEPKATKKLINSAVDDLTDAVNKAIGG